MPEELEWQTRRERINRKLLSLNPAWKIVKFSPGLDLTSLACHAVEEYPTANGPAYYALFVKGKLLGILEAKKVTVSPQNEKIWRTQKRIYKVHRRRCIIC